MNETQLENVKQSIERLLSGIEYILFDESCCPFRFGG